MKNPTTIMYSLARLMAIPCISASIIFISGCQRPWHGKFVAPAQNNCILLQYVDVNGDNTADVKYKALYEEANFECKFNEETSILYISELNKEWAFRLSNDTLFEISNMDPYCFMVKEK